VAQQAIRTRCWPLNTPLSDLARLASLSQLHENIQPQRVTKKKCKGNEYLENKRTRDITEEQRRRW